MTSWTMVCPACFTPPDEDGYCTDAGCRNLGKAVEVVPREWVDQHADGRAVMQVRDLVFEVNGAKGPLLTFDGLPIVRRELEDRLTGLPLVTDSGRELGWIVSANVVLGGDSPVDVAGDARRAQSAMDVLDTCLHTWTDTAGGFRCEEAETIAEFIRAWRSGYLGEEAATAFLLAHAHGDDQPGDMHAVSADGVLITKEG